VTVVTDPRDVRAADVLILTVKTYDTESALASVRHLDVGAALSIQNGVVKDEQLARTFGAGRVLGAAVIVSGEVLPDDAVRFTLNDRFAVGELPNGTSSRVGELTDALAKAGLRAEASEHIRTVEWSKYALFVSGAAVAALTRMETAKFLSDPDAARLVVALVREIGQIAARLGIPLEDAGLLPIRTLCEDDADRAVARVRERGDALGARAPSHKISTLQDLERGRRLEIDETLGDAVRRAAALGMSVPTIETCYRLLSSIDRRLR
jgi:2-dehydropantoate 2-reductase